MRDMREVFEKALSEDPDDRAASAAYADWLTERGDLRGEFMQTQLALEDEGRKPAERKRLRKRERELLKAHQGEWLGGLADFVLKARPRWTARFERGRLASLTIPRLTVASARILARDPGARLLRELVVLDVEAEAPRNYQRGRDVPSGVGTFPGLYPLVGSANLAHLRRLQLGDRIPGPKPEDEAGTDSLWGGDPLPKLVQSMPRLGELCLNLTASYSFEAPLFRSGALRSLRVLEIYEQAVPLELGRLGGNPALRRLERLVLHLRAYECIEPMEEASSLKQLDAVFRSGRLRSLRELRLVRTMIGGPGVQALVASGILARLRSLELPLNCIRDDGAKALAACPDVAKLERLDLSYNRLTERGIRALRKASPRLTADEQFTGRRCADEIDYLYGDSADDFSDDTME